MIGALGIFGFLIGLMIGRLFHPDALRLAEVEVVENGLQLWFNVEPRVRDGHIEGVYLLRFEGLGREQQGRLLVDGKAATWRLQRDKRELELRILAARPLRGEWHAQALDGRWRLVVSLREE